jgi:hypothetical protein
VEARLTGSTARSWPAGAEGFVTATAPYQRFIQENDLEPRLLAALSPAKATEHRIRAIG